VSDVAPVAARLERIDKALKVWAVATYGLKSAGPPPVYQNPWQPNHICIVKGFNKLNDDFRTFRIQASHETFRWTSSNRRRLERFELATDGYQKLLTRIGVDFYSDALDVLAKTPEKIQPMPITNTLLILGGLGFAGYIAAPQIRNFFSKDSPLPPIDRNGMERQVRKALAMPKTARLQSEAEDRRASRRRKLRGPTVDALTGEIQDRYLSEPLLAPSDEGLQPEYLQRGLEVTPVARQLSGGGYDEDEDD
jgi:hypothetical protein